MNAFWALIPAALVLGCVMELAARWWIRRRRAYYVWPPNFRMHQHLEPGVFPGFAPVARLEVNRDGEIGDEPPPPSKQTYRILVAGGSVAEGFFLDQPERWPMVLQRLLNRPEYLKALRVSRVHVGNIGRSAVASPELALILDRVLPRYGKLDAIVILSGANDIWRWLQAGAPKEFSLRPLPITEIFGIHPEGPFGWSPRRLAFTDVYRRVRQRWQGPLVRERTGLWIREARAMRASAKEIRTTVPDPSSVLEGLQANFRRAILKAKAHAERVFVIQQPWLDSPHTAEELALIWQGGIGQPWREPVTVFYSIELLCSLMAQATARVARVAEECGVGQLDLMPLLEGDAATYYDFAHFTPKGCEAVAAHVASAILGWPASEAQASPRSAEPVAVL